MLMLFSATRKIHANEVYCPLCMPPCLFKVVLSTVLTYSTSAAWQMVKTRRYPACACSITAIRPIQLVKDSCTSYHTPLHEKEVGKYSNRLLGGTVVCSKPTARALMGSRPTMTSPCRFGACRLLSSEHKQRRRSCRAMDGLKIGPRRGRHWTLDHGRGHGRPMPLIGPVANRLNVFIMQIPYRDGARENGENVLRTE